MTQPTRKHEGQTKVTEMHNNWKIRVWHKQFYIFDLAIELKEIAFLLFLFVKIWLNLEKEDSHQLMQG